MSYRRSALADNFSSGLHGDVETRKHGAERPIEDELHERVSKGMNVKTSKEKENENANPRAEKRDVKLERESSL